MAKKKNYGDQVYNDFDLLDENFSIVLEEREKLKKLYDACVMNVATKSDVVTVKFAGISGNHFLFDGNFKDYVRVETSTSESKYLKNTNVGDSVDIYITDVIDNSNFLIKGSISELYETIAHQNLNSLDENTSVMAFIREITPAGYNIDIKYESVTLPGFMPNTLAGINKLFNPEEIIGLTFEVMIESYSKEEGTYIVSRRKYLQSLIPQEIKSLKQGEVYSGYVTGTTDFGVFVEFNNCLTGMIHKTNINPEWQEKIRQISPGFQIEFYVKEIVKNKIILTQILRETLWDSIKINQTLNGIIKDIKQFGALVILDSETNGLIHTSELEKSNRKNLSSGEQVQVKVIAIDRMSRKIFLTII